MNDTNDQLILICGVSSTGKSASLRNIKNPEKWMYLGTEAGKKLPFKSKFKEYRIDDPYQVIEAFDYAMENPNDIDGIIVDSITFLMDQYESRYVLTSNNTMKAWSDFQQFFKTLMQDRVIKFGKPVIMTAHVLSILNESTGLMETCVPIKGALKNNGVEAYFSTIVYTKKVPLRELKDYKNDMLHITEDDEIVNYKHVFQTRVTKSSVGDRIRSPMGLFSRNETFIDNDCQILLDHLNAYYN